MKRLLFEVHRWGGIALALFMSLWFFTGLVILYAEPTAPSRLERLTHAEPLKPGAELLSAGEAWQRSAAERRMSTAPSATPQHQQDRPASDTLVEARLVMQADEPVWLIEDGRARHFALSAVDGRLHPTSAEQALRIAVNWIEHDGGDSAVNFRHVETLDKPAILRNREALSPFHRISVEDGNGTELLISARTGEVVDASSRVERSLYWAGNWLHLFRPLELTKFGEFRSDALTWSAGFAVIVLVTGLIAGWLRWRPGFNGRKTYSEGRVHPYRDFYSRWHFWAGLTGGLLALSWALSGFLNGNPLKLFSAANASTAEMHRYFGDAKPGFAASWKAPARSTHELVEMMWRRLGDESVNLAYGSDGKLSAEDSSPGFSKAALQAAVQRIAGDVPIANQTLLQEYDSYYYLRHHRDPADRPLPVLRVELADATQLYLDPQDGRLLIRQDGSRRAFRWLYSALHHWDIGFLYQRPLWDAWMLIWISLGLVVSASAVVLGYRRIKRSFAPSRRSAGRRTSEPLLAAQDRAG